MLFSEYNKDTMSKKMTAEMIEKARKLHAEGMSYSKIGNAIGVSWTTIRYHLDPKSRAYSEQYRLEHKTEKREYDASYRQENAEVLKRKKRQYYESHKREIRLKQKQFHIQHPEIVKQWKQKDRHRHQEYYRQYGHQYYKLHRSELRCKNHEYALAHIEEARERARVWARNHPGKVRVHNATRRARKRNASVSLNVEQQKAIEALYKRAKEAPRIRCYLCGKLIPKGHRHVDHVVPLSKGGKHAPSNLAIVCDECNMHKHTKLPQEVGLLL